MGSFLVQKVHTVLALVFIGVFGIGVAVLILHTASTADAGTLSRWQLIQALPDEE